MVSVLTLVFIQQITFGIQIIIGMFLSGLFKKEQGKKMKKDKKVVNPQKLNVASIFGKQEEVCKSNVNINFNENCSQKRQEQFSALLEQNIVNMSRLREICWNGIPEKHRTIAWKLLLQYIPTNIDSRQDCLRKKRKDYFDMVKCYIQNPTIQLDAYEQKVYKLIHDDVVRTHPSTQLFRNNRIQTLLHQYHKFKSEHPKCGYVQGLNDIATPFIIVFLSQYLPIDFTLLVLPKGIEETEQDVFKNVEADVYWCFNKFLESILDNYANSWPGINKSYTRVQKVVQRVDSDLLTHFQSESIDFYQIYFKWVTCLLLRQFAVKPGLRLFDSFFTDPTNYFDLCEFISAALILKFSKKLKKMKFQGIMTFQQNMPTKLWAEEDVATIIAEAYVYKTYFMKN